MFALSQLTPSSTDHTLSPKCILGLNYLGCVFFPLFKYLIKDKLRHINIFKVYLSTCQFKLGSAKPEVVRSTAPAGAGCEVF